MAKISLRAYNREIEGMIEGHQVEEALAHARHVLQSFPKHLETYRLLGKAFLENQRLGEAADIFQRVLSTAPDDFVAHVGMSIIREDEGNLDASIWHMERAFEAQPYNNAIQDELRRLYGRRDGMEPAKVRLTRGALARMYLKGNLYQQAIRELRSALAEDPQRPDLQVLLANTYFQAGQRVEAVEACSMLLKKFPYCFEANRILAAILPDTERSADTEIYRQRLILMDPYFAQLNPRTTSSEGVPDSTIVLDRMEYKMGQAQLPGSTQPTWASNIGVSFQNQDEALPDWLSSDQEQGAVIPTSSGSVLPFSDPSGAFDFSSEEESPAAPAEAAQTEAIPDWMQAVGWNPSSGAFQEEASPVVFDETPEQPVADGPAAPAEIPDWMRGMAPTGIDQEPPAADLATPWLQETLPGASDSVATWLQDLAPQSGTPTQPVAPELETSIEPGELPDWLKDLPAPQTPSQTITPTSEVADWMQELSPTAGSATRQPSEDLFAQTGEAIPGEIPAWMQDIKPPEALLEDSAALAGEVPDWMRAAEVETPSSITPEATPTTSVTDFLKAIESPQPPAQASSPSSDDDLDWLKGFETEPGSGAPVSEEPAAAPAEGFPDWLKEIPTGTPAAEPASEALPAEGIPDWLTAAAQETPQVVEEEPTGVTGFLESLQAPSMPAEPIAAEELPDWLIAAQAEAPVEVTEGTPVTPVIQESAEAAMPDLSNEDAAMAWLEGLAANQGVSEDELLTSPSDRVETPPAWVQQEAGAAEAIAEPGAVSEAVEAELPGWMKEIVPEAAELPAIEPVAEALPAEGIPDWLTMAAAQEAPQIVEEESTGVTGFLESLQMPSSPAEPTAAEELPEWMQGIEIPAEAVEPVAAEIPATIGEPAAAEAALPDLSNEDAAMAWLEGLAAKQGISEDELLTSPSDRVETPPAWVQQEAGAAEAVTEPGAVSEAVEAELPDWMKEIVPEAAELPAIEPVAEALPAEGIPDWLTAAAQDAPQIVEEEPTGITGFLEALQMPSSPAEPTAAEELPDWLIAAQAESPTEAMTAPVAEISPVTQEPAEAALPDLSNEDAAMAWLEGLAAKQGISEDELLTSPSDRVETPPAWVQQEVIEAAPPVQEPAEAEELPNWMREIETPVETVEPVAAEIPTIGEPATTEATLPDLSNEDAAMAWLEGLAAKQGISEDELLTSPSDRVETPPAWVQQEAGFPAATEPEAVEAELPDQMKAIAPEAVVQAAAEAEELPTIEPAAEALPAEGIPDWLTAAAQDTPQIVEEEPTGVTGFLEALQMPSTPAEPTAAEELPDWLIAAQAESPTEAMTAPVAEISPVTQEPTEAALPDLSNEDAAMAWLEGLAAKQGISEDELLTSPSDRVETPPAWVQQEVIEAAPPVQVPAEAEELPAWMREIETPVEPVEPVAAEIPTIGEPATAEATLPDLSNEDAAMAWLEGLAAKQGISEDELLTSPSDRVETPPAWVQQEVIEAAPPVQEPAEAEELPNWMREIETPVETVEPAAMEVAPIEAPKETASEVAPAPALEEELPAWLSAEEPAAPSEIPAWMQETQITHRDATPQPSEWIAAEQVYAALAEQNAEAERLDVNSASLVQLEALPGIGFILAQNIINHRDSTGKFSRLEDLANVPGIGPATIEEIRSWVKVIPPDKPKSVYRPQPSAGDIAQARLVLSQGNTATASSLYTALLKRGHPVQEIIADLNDALYRHPADVDLWQALGDALMRDGQLQESLNAYTKAEELLQ